LADNPAGMARYCCVANEAYAAQQITRPGLADMPPPATRAALLRCLFGNSTGRQGLPCHCLCGPRERWPVTGECPYCASEGWCPWLTPAVTALARAIYDDRDWAALPVLADALEDADCADAALLGHLRSPGLHARGCWALDLLLGKE
jgi:hypothetical protein